MKVCKIKSTTLLDFYSADISGSLKIPLVGSPVHAGFPSPAEDYIDLSIDLNKELIKNPSATFLAKVKGLSMKDVGIYENDILVVDKSLEPYNKCIAVCFIDGEFTLKRIKIERKCLFLMPANTDFKPIKVTELNNFQIWGIVTYIIKKV
jgi:DNA polymerase V